MMICGVFNPIDFPIKSLTYLETDTLRLTSIGVAAIIRVIEMQAEQALPCSALSDNCCRKTSPEA
jgi:hypothetical protein